MPIGRSGSGEKVVVHDRVVNVYRRGHGAPAVVFEAGHLDLAFDWTDVVDRCARTTLAVAYDRPGLGGSQPSRGPRTPTGVARDLRELLEAMEIPAPFVLVGHSLGGLYVRRFAELFPADVGGLVLVDPSHPDQRSRQAPEASSLYRSLRQRHEMPVLFTRDRWVERIATHRPGLSRSAIQARVDAGFRRGSLRTAQEHLVSAWGRRGRVGSRPLPHVPLVVVSAGRPESFPHIPPGVAIAMLRQKQRLHEEIARLVPGGRVVVARRSGHSVMWQQPELIARVVSGMVREIRAARRH